MDIVALIGGLLLILVGANALTDGAASVAKRFNISSLVIGNLFAERPFIHPDGNNGCRATYNHKGIENITSDNIPDGHIRTSFQCRYNADGQFGGGCTKGYDR